MEKKTKISVWYFVVASFAIMMLQSMWSQSQKVEVLPYSEVQHYLEADQVEEIIVSETHVYGTFKLPLADGKRQFSAIRVDPDLAKDLAKYEIKVSGATEQTFFSQLFAWVLPPLIFLGIWFFVVRRFAGKQGMGGGLMSIGKSRAKIYVEAIPR